MREESNEYVVTPTPDGTKKVLTASREQTRKGKLAEMDAEIASDLRDDLTKDREDGLN